MCYILYDWLLDQLESTLFLVGDPECKGMSLPWRHLTCAALLCCLLVLLTAAQVMWLTLKVFCKSGMFFDAR